MNQDGRFIDINQLAEKLSLKTSHIRSMIFKKEIPFNKFGRLVRFETAEIEKWIKETKHNAQ